MKNLIVILLGAVCASIGAGGAWLAARPPAAKAETEAAAATSDQLSPQTLKNLGVVVGVAKLGTYVEHVEVQATVVDRPRNDRPLQAPLGGIVTEVLVASGGRARERAVLFRIVRDPIARPELALVGDILAPLGEKLHDAVASYRRAKGDVEIAQRELSRVNKLNAESGELPAVPRNRVVEIEYAVARAELALRNAEAELSWHGVKPGEKMHGHRAADLWRQALEHSGLWPKQAELIRRALPADARDEPWTIAIVGELAAAGVVDQTLADAVRDVPALARRFSEAAGLLRAGHSVASVRLLAQQGALEPVIELRAPEGDWDVHVLDARVGQRVDAGTRLALLHDARTMWLRFAPVGDERRAVADAIAKNQVGTAMPLIPGAGPKLENIAVRSWPLAVCSNTPIKDDDPRTWALREGMRYVVKLPVRRFPKRFVLPRGAVADDGPDRVVFIPDGKTFRPVPVHVEAETQDQVVIADDGALFDGDEVVLGGAYALALALQADTGAVDPHAGHNH